MNFYILKNLPNIFFPRIDPLSHNLFSTQKKTTTQKS